MNVVEVPKAIEHAPRIEFRSDPARIDGSERFPTILRLETGSLRGPGRGALYRFIMSIRKMEALGGFLFHLGAERIAVDITR